MSEDGIGTGATVGVHGARRTAARAAGSMRAWGRIAPLPETLPGSVEAAPGDGFFGGPGRAGTRRSAGPVVRDRGRFAGVPVMCLTSALRPLRYNRD